MTIAIFVLLQVAMLGVGFAVGRCTKGPHHVAYANIHLTRDQVADLIPRLQKFLDAGEL